MYIDIEITKKQGVHKFQICIDINLNEYIAYNICSITYNKHHFIYW